MKQVSFMKPLKLQKNNVLYSFWPLLVSRHLPPNHLEFLEHLPPLSTWQIMGFQ